MTPDQATEVVMLLRFIFVSILILILEITFLLPNK
jgi:hypothetical protein